MITRNDTAERDLAEDMWGGTVLSEVSDGVTVHTAVHRELGGAGVEVFVIPRVGQPPSRCVLMQP